MQYINRKEFAIKTLLILISIWVTVNLVVQAIPSLNSTIRFIDNIKYEILGGYTSDFFIQRNVIYAFAYNVIYTLTLVTVLIFSTISIFNKKQIKMVGITIMVQNSLLLALELWECFLTDALNDIALIHIKKYLIIIVIITIGFTVERPTIFGGSFSHYILYLSTLLFLNTACCEHLLANMAVLLFRLAYFLHPVKP